MTTVYEWDDATPIESSKLTDQAISLAKLCIQEVTNKLKLKELPSTVGSVIQEWILQAMRQAAQVETTARMVAENRLKDVTRDLIMARNHLRTAEAPPNFCPNCFCSDCAR